MELCSILWAHVLLALLSNTCTLEYSPEYLELCSILWAHVLEPLLGVEDVLAEEEAGVLLHHRLACQERIIKIAVANRCIVINPLTTTGRNSDQQIAEPLALLLLLLSWVEQD